MWTTSAVAIFASRQTVTVRLKVSRNRRSRRDSTGCWHWGRICDNKSTVNTGAQFRLLFITSDTRDATSSNINDYNTFVATAAKRNPDISDSVRDALGIWRGRPAAS